MLQVFNFENQTFKVAIYNNNFYVLPLQYLQKTVAPLRKYNTAFETILKRKRDLNEAEEQEEGHQRQQQVSDEAESYIENLLRGEDDNTLLDGNDGEGESMFYQKQVQL